MEARKSSDVKPLVKTTKSKRNEQSFYTDLLGKRVEVRFLDGNKNYGTLVWVGKYTLLLSNAEDFDETPAKYEILVYKQSIRTVKGVIA